MCPFVAARERAGQDIRVELNKSVVFPLGKPATRVSISNTDIADVTLITPQQVLIVSKRRVGQTNLIVWYSDQNISYHDVEVFIPSHLFASIREALKIHAPGARVKPSLICRSLVLDGYVEDQETLDRVLKIALSFVPCIENITNLIRVRSAIQNAVERAIPKDAKANVRVSMGQNGIVLEGTVDCQDTMLRLMDAARTFTPNVTNLMTVQGPQQVQVEVIIAEVSRSAMNQLDLGAVLTWDWGSLTKDVLGEVASSTEDELEREASTTFGGVTSSYGTAFQLMIQGSDDTAILSVLKGQGLARILATPTLVTLNGQEAEFIVGGEIPYKTREEIVFRDYGIQLKFTPYITGKETITLKVEPTISSPDWSLSLGDEPGLKSRSASTVLQLKDGQTFVMAGLLTQEISRVTNKVPFLGEIPIIGTLFNSKQFIKNETELVIIATPRLVRALNPGEVPPLPGEDLDMDTTDVQFFLLNDWDPSSSGKTASEPVPLLCGPTGFAK